jgi:uncharacterized protein
MVLGAGNVDRGRYFISETIHASLEELEGFAALEQQPATWPGFIENQKQLSPKEQLEDFALLVDQDCAGVVALLLAKLPGVCKADACTPETNTRRPMVCLAAQAGASRSLRALLKAGANPRQRSSIGKEALFFCTLYWRGEASKQCLKVLLEAGVPIDTLDDMHVSALALAVIQAKTEVVQFLLDQGASPNLHLSQCDTQQIPHLAAMHAPTPAMIKYLVQAGADLSLRDGTGRTPLHTAAFGNHITGVIALLGCGADPDAQHVLGLTPLMDAIAEGHTQVACALLKRSDLIGVYSNLGMNALHSVVMMGKEKLDIFNAMLPLVSDEDLDVPTRGGMTSKGVRVHEFGDTPLHIALQRGGEEAAKALLKRGACRTTPNNAGKTPLISAASAGSLVSVLAVLGTAGKLKLTVEEINAADNYGWTALHHAAITSLSYSTGVTGAAGSNFNERAAKCCAVLIAAGASLDAKTSVVPPYFLSLASRLNLLRGGEHDAL